YRYNDQLSYSHVQSCERPPSGCNRIVAIPQQQKDSDDRHEPVNHPVPYRHRRWSLEQWPSKQFWPFHITSPFFYSLKAAERSLVRVDEYGQHAHKFNFRHKIEHWCEMRQEVKLWVTAPPYQGVINRVPIMFP